MKMMLPILVALVSISSSAHAELSGESYDYRYDGKDIGHRERAWAARAYVPDAAKGAERGLPLVIFLHGLNRALIPHRWTGGGSEGDVREIVGRLVDDQTLPPLLVAAPSSIVKSQVSRGASWNHFDLDNFIDRTIERLDGLSKVDETRIVVAGHSGAGCSEHGGLATSHRSKRQLLGLVAIDTCMAGAFARTLTAKSHRQTHVVVGYQTRAWNRPFALFTRLFNQGVEDSPADPNTLRILDLQAPTEAPHDATVALTLTRWLPKMLPRP